MGGGVIEERIRASYRIVSPLPAAKAAESVAGEQSTALSREFREAQLAAGRSEIRYRALGDGDRVEAGDPPALPPPWASFYATRFWRPA